MHSIKYQYKVPFQVTNFRMHDMGIKYIVCGDCRLNTFIKLLMRVQMIFNYEMAYILIIDNHSFEL